MMGVAAVVDRWRGHRRMSPGRRSNSGPVVDTAPAPSGPEPDPDRGMRGFLGSVVPDCHNAARRRSYARIRRRGASFPARRCRHLVTLAWMANSGLICGSLRLPHCCDASRRSGCCSELRELGHTVLALVVEFNLCPTDAVAVCVILAMLAQSRVFEKGLALMACSGPAR